MRKFIFLAHLALFSSLASSVSYAVNSVGPGFLWGVETGIAALNNNPIIYKQIDIGVMGVMKPAIVPTQSNHHKPLAG